jgi:hypothetical protein
VISAGGNGDIAPDWSPAAVLSDDERRMVREYRMVRHTAEVLRERVLRALGATRTAIGGFPLRDGATRLEAVATALVRAERQPGFARANGDVSPIAPDEAAALSIAAWVEDVPADAAAYAVVRGLWAKRLRSARARVGARRRRHGAIGGE